jgi:hypothetical protein
MSMASKIYLIPLFSGNSYPYDREAPSETAERMTLPDPAPKSTIQPQNPKSKINEFSFI